MAGISSRMRIPVAQAGLVALFLAVVAPAMTRGQGIVPSTPFAPVPDPAPRPVVFPVMGDDTRELEPAIPKVPGPPVFVQGAPPARVVMGPIDVITESIFGEASVDDWQPLSLSTFFSEGWDRPWAKSPVGTNGAPKQNWFGAADAVFARLNSVSLFNVNGMTNHPGLLLTPLPWSPAKPKASGNEYWASDVLYLPLNQRLELVVSIPFIASNKDAAGHYVGNFGDLTFSGRFRLIEQRNFTMQAYLSERTPTGKTVNGNDINFVTPAVEGWWNFAPNWVVRGGTGINIDTGRNTATSVYFTNMAMGRYLTTKDAHIFKELVAHVAVSTLSDVTGRKDYISDVYIAPGLRTGLGKDGKWYALAAALIPVSGPHPYAWQPMFSLVRNF